MSIGKIGGENDVVSPAGFYVAKKSRKDGMIFWPLISNPAKVPSND
jgi:hypothetical protein